MTGAAGATRSSAAPRAARQAARAKPERRAGGKPNGIDVVRKPSGSFDAITGRLAEGWAYDASAPSAKLTVQIFDDERLLGEQPANLFRQDLLDEGIGDGCHSFRFILPLELFDGRSHRIAVKLKDLRFQLNGSPKLLDAQPLPIEQRFGFPTAGTAVAAPLSDVQFTVLRALTAVSELMLAQSKVLGGVAEQVARLGGGALGQPATGESRPAPRAGSEQGYGALLPAALTSARGRHDYLFFSVIDWEFRIQRPQHLARELAARGNRVFYVSKTFAAHDAPERFRIRAQPAEGVFEIVLRCRPPLPDIYQGIADSQQVADLCTALGEAGRVLDIRRPVGIVQFPGWYPVATALSGTALIHDCLDHVAGFNNVSPLVVAQEARLIDAADGVVATSAHLAAAVGKRRPAETIRNAAEIGYFSAQPPALYQPPRRPVIGYYGAIADWFDMDLVLEVAGRHPEWQFVLVGATEGADIGQARQRPNIALLGEKPYGELTQYLYAFDVCIIPFKPVELTKATNPVKVYEYLCAGKPVVATDMPELRLLPRGLVEIAAGPAAFARKIAAALEPNEPAAERRRAWAAGQSWASRARQMAELAERQWPKVSIVVLCHDNLQFTTACLESILRYSDYPELELICVDNASRDGTPAYLADLAARHDFVRVISSEANRGFAAGNNLGMRAATGAVQILLNNDTYVTKGWVRDLIRPLLRDRQIGMSGPLTNMIGNEQKLAINYANMQEMAAASAAFVATRRRTTFAVDCLAFFCVAIRKDVVDEVGWLDESYGAGFFEDDDYCARVRRAGYRLVVCDDVFVHHHFSASFGKLEAQEREALMRRNRKLFERKWGAWKPHAYRAEAGFGA
ncbi:MAG: glycosyltransferase [Alphaproteobacteria bacterium]|nr:glycosyltransferase [Alphaproteobacteria bacterium]